MGGKVVAFGDTVVVGSVSDMAACDVVMVEPDGWLDGLFTLMGAPR